MKMLTSPMGFLFIGSALMILGALRIRYTSSFSATRRRVLAASQFVIALGSLLYSVDDSPPLWHSPAHLLAALAAFNFGVAAALLMWGVRSTLAKLVNRSLAVMLVAVLSLAAGQIAAAQQEERAPMPATQHINGKPVYEQNVTPAVESTLPLIWAASDAVLDVEVTSSEVKGIGSRPVHVRTFFTSKVLHVYKGNLRKGSTVVFTQAAGQLELPDMFIRVDGAEPLATRERYIVISPAAPDIRAVDACRRTRRRFQSAQWFHSASGIRPRCRGAPKPRGAGVRRRTGTCWPAHPSPERLRRRLTTTP